VLCESGGSSTGGTWLETFPGKKITTRFLSGAAGWQQL
jgi:hypothetical protein